MKRAFAFLVSAISALSFTPSLGMAKDFGDAVQDFVRVFESSAGKPQGVRYPQLAGRVRALFLGKGVTRIETWASTNGAKRAGNSIYIAGSRIEIVASGDDMNISTDDKYVYEWKVGEKAGIRIKRSNEDLVQYVYFATDPSWIMAGLYAEYLQKRSPAHVTHRPLESFDEIEFEKPPAGFEAVYVSQSPLWFDGFRARNGAELIELRFSKPAHESEIPKAIMDRKLKIEFRDSNDTLGNLMVFL
jgi:hypothetical protein